MCLSYICLSRFGSFGLISNTSVPTFTVFKSIQPCLFCLFPQLVAASQLPDWYRTPQERHCICYLPSLPCYKLPFFNPCVATLDKFLIKLNVCSGSQKIGCLLKRVKKLSWRSRFLLDCHECTGHFPRCGHSNWLRKPSGDFGGGKNETLTAVRGEKGHSLAFCDVRIIHMLTLRGKISLRAHSISINVGNIK